MMTDWKRITAALAAALLSLSLCSCDLYDSLDMMLNDETPVDFGLEEEVRERQKELGSLRGYSALQNDSERRVYAIVDLFAADAERTHFVLSNDGTPDRLSEILEMYRSDHPEVFWISDQSGYEYSTHSTYTEVDLIYSFTGEELEEARKLFDEAVDAFLESVPEDSDDYEKELYLNDYLLDLCEYDDAAADREEVVANEQNAYGALVDNMAVCEGYTRAFQLLCTKMGIDCVPVNGTCDSEDLGNGNHIWNAVNIEDDWYYVDVTWNDVQPDEEDYMLTEIERHLYFNITTDALEDDHKISPLYGSGEESDYYNAFVPECTAESCSYFNRSVVHISSADDSDELCDALARAAEYGSDTFEFFIEPDADYSEVVDEIVNSKAYEWITYANKQNDSDHQLSDDCRIYTYEEVGAAALSLEYE